MHEQEQSENLVHREVVGARGRLGIQGSEHQIQTFLKHFNRLALKPCLLLRQDSAELIFA